MLPCLAQDPFPLWSNFRHPAIEFPAQLHITPRVPYLSGLSQLFWAPGSEK